MYLGLSQLRIPGSTMARSIVQEALPVGSYGSDDPAVWADVVFQANFSHLTTAQIQGNSFTDETGRHTITFSDTAEIDEAGGLIDDTTGIPLTVPNSPDFSYNNEDGTNVTGNAMLLWECLAGMVNRDSTEPVAAWGYNGEGNGWMIARNLCLWSTTDASSSVTMDDTGALSSVPENEPIVNDQHIASDKRRFGWANEAGTTSSNNTTALILPPYDQNGEERTLKLYAESGRNRIFGIRIVKGQRISIASYGSTIITAGGWPGA